MRGTLTKLIAVLLLCIVSVTGEAQIIRTIAGNGTFGTAFSGDNGPAVSAALGGLFGVCVDTSGNVFFTDQYNYVLRRINKNGILKTVAGTGFPGHTGDGGPATAARLGVVQPVIMDAAGNIYVGDAGSKMVRKISPSGIITTVAGDPSVLTYGTGDGGPATNAGLGSVSDLAIDGAGNLYIADGNTRVRKVNTSGIISTVVGGTIGHSGDGGPATAAAFNGITGVTFDRLGNMYVADLNNSVIRKINAAGIVTHFAGQAGVFNFSGDGGPATTARLNSPLIVRTDTANNVYFSDQGNNRIRKINTAGIISTYAGTVGGYGGDGGAAISAKMSSPGGLCFDRRGNMYIADKGTGVPGSNPWGRRIRQIFKADTFHISVSPSPVLCGNTFATFTAHPSVAFYSFRYQWKRNGIDVGTNSPVYSYPYINNQDTFTCTLIDTANANIIVGYSDTIIMTVLPPILPEVHVTSTGDTVCAGLPITFHGTAVNGGTAPVFRWYRFGTLLWTAPTFTYTPSTGDIITCILTSSDACAHPDTARVDIPLSVIPSFLPEIDVTAYPDTTIHFLSEIITLFTNVTYGGTNPTYQWYNGSGPIAGATSSSYSQEIYHADTFYCVMHSDAFCAVPAIDTSNYVYIGIGKLGINNMSQAHSTFSLYPNPSNGHFTIKGLINDLQRGDVHIEVTNVLGQQLYSRVVDTHGSVELPVTLTGASPGMYYLVICDDGGKRVIPFVIK